MFSKRTALSVLFVLLISLNFIIMCSNEIKAHEIFYDGYGPAFNPIPVSWHHKSSGKAHLRISNSGLSKTYADQYSTVRNAWISSTSKISITTVPNTQSTVDMVTTTKD